MEDPLFAGFELGHFDHEDCQIHYRAGGEGPPLLLLHGFPQTGAMWAPVAQQLAEHFHVIIPDLRGYGRSSAPQGSSAMTKRVMASDMIALMKAHGHKRFSIAGHDRGGRVAYRLALDAPEAVERLVILDILPTICYWEALDRDFAMKIYHWTFLAQDYPLPETLIAAAGDFYVDDKLARWSAAGDLSPFAPLALEEYRENARSGGSLRAMCDDYRAGAGEDLADDRRSREMGQKINAPTQILWGASGIAQNAATPLQTWKEWCLDVTGAPIKAGHFLVEEAPEATLAMMLTFLAADNG
ncbi:MAG: alpha/beta hydrolase [Neomegalonema sp.]|nr:alpha/beta hydrolase [Neomegalonema sp.]